MSLRAIGASTVPVVVSYAGQTLIATVNAVAATSVTFSSIPQVYKHLNVVFFDVYQSTTNDGFGIRLNNDTTAGRHVYRNNGVYSTGAAADRGSSTYFAGSATDRYIIPKTTATSNVYDAMARGVFTIYRYSNTTENKFCQWQTAGDTNGVFGTGQFLSTNAITQIEFIRSGSQTVTGTFHLYGVA